MAHFDGPVADIWDVFEWNGRDGLVLDDRNHYQWVEGQEPWKRVNVDPFWNDHRLIQSFKGATRKINIYGQVKDIPDLIWCKIYNSDFANRDRMFFACFAFRNRRWFNMNRFHQVISWINHNFTQEFWDDIVQKYIYLGELALRQHNDSLCHYYAYCIDSEFVTDLNGHRRHEERGNAYYHPGANDDVCERYRLDYNQLVICDPLYLEPELANLSDTDSCVWEPSSPLLFSDDTSSFKSLHLSEASPGNLPATGGSSPVQEDLSSAFQDESFDQFAYEERRNAQDIAFMFDETSVSDAELCAICSKYD